MTIKETEQGTHRQKGKKTLDELLTSKEVITGKELVQNIEDTEKRRREFEESVEQELRNRRNRR